MSEDALLARLIELRRKISEKLVRAEREASDFRRDVAAVDRSLELLGVNVNELGGLAVDIDEAVELAPERRDSGSSPMPKVEKSSSRNGRPQKIRITQEVRNAVQEAEGEFDTQDVVRWIKEKYPNAEVRSATVSSTIWRMANEWGTIEKVRDGYGSEPNTYRKVSHDGPAQEGFPDEEHASDEGAIVNERALMSE